MNTEMRERNRMKSNMGVLFEAFYINVQTMTSYIEKKCGTSVNPDCLFTT